MAQDIADQIVDAVREVESQTSKPSSAPRSGGSLASIQQAALSGRRGGSTTPWQFLGISQAEALIPVRMGNHQTTYGRLLAEFFVLEQEPLKRFQKALWDGGFYKRGKPQFGAYDDDSYSAYQEALDQAIRRQFAEQIAATPIGEAAQAFGEGTLDGS